MLIREVNGDIIIMEATTINMKEMSNYTEDTEWALIERALKEQQVKGFKKHNLLFSRFDESHLEQVLETGHENDGDILREAFRFDYLAKEGVDVLLNFENSPVSHVAVYRAPQIRAPLFTPLTETEEANSEDDYKFNHPDRKREALVAVLRLDYTEAIHKSVRTPIKIGHSP